MVLISAILSQPLSATPSHLRCLPVLGSHGCPLSPSRIPGEPYLLPSECLPPSVRTRSSFTPSVPAGICPFFPLLCCPLCRQGQAWLWGAAGQGSARWGVHLRLQTGSHGLTGRCRWRVPGSKTPKTLALCGRSSRVFRVDGEVSTAAATSVEIVGGELMFGLMRN